MAKVFGINTKIRGKVGEYIYCQTKVGTVVSEAPVKPITPLRTQSWLAFVDGDGRHSNSYHVVES